MLKKNTLTCSERVLHSFLTLIRKPFRENVCMWMRNIDHESVQWNHLVCRKLFSKNVMVQKSRKKQWDKLRQQKLIECLKQKSNLTTPNEGKQSSTKPNQLNLLIFEKPRDTYAAKKKYIKKPTKLHSSLPFLLSLYQVNSSLLHSTQFPFVIS